MRTGIERDDFQKISISSKEQENFVRNKKKSSDTICNINIPIGQGMIGNFLVDEEKTEGSGNAVLQKDAGNFIRGVQKQRRSHKKKGDKLTYARDQITLLGHSVRKGSLEKLTPTGHIERKMNRRRQRIT